MRLPFLPSLLLMLAAAGSSACKQQDPDFARATVIESLSETIGGEKAIAMPGDILLENQSTRVAILATRNSMGPGRFGGSIVDADLQRTQPEYLHGHGLDQFAEMFTTVNMNVPMPTEPEDVFILQDGSDGGPAIVRVVAPAEPFLTLLSALWLVVLAPEFHLVTDYIAEPGVPWIRIRTTAVVNWDGTGELENDGEPVDYSDDNLPIIDWAIETGLALGDFYLSGGSVDVFGPGMGFDEDGAVFEAMQRGENTFTDPFRFDFVAGVGDGVSYGIAPVQGSAFIPLFTASQTVVVGGGLEGDGTSARFPANSAFMYERLFFVGEGDVGSLVDQYVEAREVPYGEVSGHVLDVTGQPVSGASVFVFKPGADAPWSQWETDVSVDDTNLDGSFGGRLPVGQWELLVHRRGAPDGERVPIVVDAGEAVEVALPAYRGGMLTLSVRDEVGRLVPSKVSIFRADGEPLRNPTLGDGFVGGAPNPPEMVLFPMYGEGEAELPAGTYYAVASRGIEYEIDISEDFVVDETRSQHLDLQVVRSVETEGWVSADLHVHAAPSHDSGVALADRVRTMVCEGVEFFASTDHDFITDYAPTVELLGLEEWVETAVGNEVTTIEVGHFLGFPLKHDFTVEAGGALDWTDETPGEIVDALRDQSDGDAFVFVGHPRDGILGYFDEYGFDPYAGSPSDPEPVVNIPTIAFTNDLIKEEHVTWDFDGLELLNGKRSELFRTPTQDELDRFADGEEIGVYSFFERTMEEQQDLIRGDARLGYGIEGQIDDWFSLLNLGYRYTALGNSDTHGWTGTESGCPRNFVMSDTDDPAFIDDQAIADAVREHRVVASYGPFVRMFVDGEPIGSDVTASGDTVELELEVQAPTWMQVDRIELYGNGTLIKEWALQQPQDDSLVYHGVGPIELDGDTWLVAIVMGQGDLRPLFTPVEIPYVDLQMVVTEALVGVPAVGDFLEPAAPIPRENPVHPFALTNPIWVDVDGGGFDAPGLPDWLEAPEAPPADE